MAAIRIMQGENEGIVFVTAEATLQKQSDVKNTQTLFSLHVY